MNSDIRRPVVAGQFYPAQRDALLSEIAKCFRDNKIGPGTTIPIDLNNSDQPVENVSRTECFVVPHAGFMYSGSVAAHAYAVAYKTLICNHKSVKIIILGPNHRGIGSGISLSPSSAWETPLGQVKVDQLLSKEISEASELIDVDRLAHSYEHSIEVQLPFVQFIASQDELSLVPICLMLQDQETVEEISEAIFNIIQSEHHRKESFLILGSSDLTHYEAQPNANFKDKRLLEKVFELDLKSYYATLERNNVTACGYGAIAAVMGISKKLGKRNGTLLKYASSGDITGDMSSVVGYSAVHFV